MKYRLKRHTTVQLEWIRWRGFFAVLFASFTSGLAGFYFEKVIKSAPISIWVRNIQLGSFGAIFAAIFIELKDGWLVVLSEGTMHNYNSVLCVVILNQAFGGLVVGLVIQKLDNIAKGFANACSVITGCLGSIWLFDWEPTALFAVGSFLIIISSLMYKFLPSKTSPSNTNTELELTPNSSVSPKSNEAKTLRTATDGSFLRNHVELKEDEEQLLDLNSHKIEPLEEAMAPALPNFSLLKMVESNDILSVEAAAAIKLNNIKSIKEVEVLQNNNIDETEL